VYNDNKKKRKEKEKGIFIKALANVICLQVHHMVSCRIEFIYIYNVGFFICYSRESRRCESRRGGSNNNDKGGGTRERERERDL